MTKIKIFVVGAVACTFTLSGTSQTAEQNNGAESPGKSPISLETTQNSNGGIEVSDATTESIGDLAESIERLQWDCSR